MKYTLVGMMMIVGYTMEGVDAYKMGTNSLLS